MDQHTMNGFTEEMDELIKEGFAPLSFIGKGFKTIGGMVRGGLKGGAGSHTGSISRLYRKGAAKGGEGLGGVWGGVKNVAKSRYGAAAAAAGTAGVGGYGAYRAGGALMGGGQQQRYR